jgi:phosphatidylglycerophosphate synthase
MRRRQEFPSGSPASCLRWTRASRPGILMTVGRIALLRARIQRRTLNVYDTLFTRRVSIYFTVALAPLGVTPNQVSAVAALVGGTSCVLMAFGSPVLLLCGVGLLHLYAVLDSVDGELARMTQRFSLTGLFIEDLSAYAMINGFNLAIAWRLYADARLIWPLVAAVSISAFGRNVMPVARRAVLKSIITRRPYREFPPSGAEGAPSQIRQFVQENVIHTTNQWVVLSALLALATYHMISTRIVAALFAGTLGLLAARELVALILMLCQDRLDRELSRVYLAALQSPETNGRNLSNSSAL